MYILKTVVKWGWCPVLITAVAVVSVMYEWSVQSVALVLGIILIIGLVVAVLGARERELESFSFRLKQLVGYFNRRFAGNSSLSIFVIIDGLFSVDKPKLWEWARACDMSQRIFNTWCDSFMVRMEGDIRARKFGINLRAYLNELWLMNNHYYEFVEQFYEVAAKVDIPQETTDQYNRFVTEYNAFANDFRDNISELRKIIKAGIEPPSVKLAKELSAVKPVQTSQEGEIKPSQAKRDKGYYL